MAQTIQEKISKLEKELQELKSREKKKNKDDFFEMELAIIVNGKTGVDWCQNKFWKHDVKNGQDSWQERIYFWQSRIADRLDVNLRETELLNDHEKDDYGLGSVKLFFVDFETV